jgi:hypothetical protein
MRNAHKILVVKSKRKRPLRILRHREDNIKMGLREIGYEDVDWFYLAQGRVQ